MQADEVVTGSMSSLTLPIYGKLKKQKGDFLILKN